MSGFESLVEGDEDRAWEVALGKLRSFLLAEATRTEIEGLAGSEHESFDGTHEAAQALEALEVGDFEAASVYLDQEIEKAYREQSIETDPKKLVEWEIRSSHLETLKDSLDRQ